MNAATNNARAGIFSATVLIASLGYLVDVYDLFLYNANRVASLADLGLGPGDITSAGVTILSWQVLGTLLGGFIWGVLGDRIGRRRTMIGSILLYSLASLGSAAVQDYHTYALMRFLTGLGVAGEMGVGLVLVAEMLRGHKRGWGIALFAVLGLGGVVLAALAANTLHWRTAYVIGGIAGLLLLLLRTRLKESGLFEKVKQGKAARGDLAQLFTTPGLLQRYASIICIVMANFYVTGLLITFAPEIGVAKDMFLPVKAGTALLIYALAAMVGDVIAAGISRLLQKRVAVIALYLGLNTLAVAWLLTSEQPSLFDFYFMCGVLGLCNFWVLFSMTAAEQFGTNLRATAATSALNAGRAMLIIMSNAFLLLKTDGHDVVTAMTYVGLGVLMLALVSLFGLSETYHRDLNYLEGEKQKK